MMQRSGASTRPGGIVGDNVIHNSTRNLCYLGPRSANSLGIPYRTRKIAANSSRDGDIDTYVQPLWWQRVGAATAAAVFTLQSCLTPGLALAAELTQTAQTEPLIITPDVLETLPPLPSDFPPLPELKLPKMQHLTLKNGLRVILLEDEEAPLVRGTLLMRGGQRASPADKVGLASISAAIQRSGGSTQHPNSVLDEALEDLAAAIEGGAGSDSISMGFSCLSEDAPQVMSLFSEVITSPALPESKLELFKTQVFNSIAHKNDNPSAIPAREAAKLIYGENSPYAREPSLKGILSISADDVRQWLATWERPDSSVLGIVGSFNSKEMRKLIESSALGQWQPAVPGPPNPIPATPLPDQSSIQGKIYLVDRPQASQASVVMAEPGIVMMDPDEVALDVLGGLLNSFGGRLFDELRSKEGLAYSISGGWATAPLDHPGLFIASAETAQPAELLRGLRAALKQAVMTAPTSTEVENARQESVNSFIFGFTSKAALLRRAVAFELFNIPQDYPFTYKKKLEKVTEEDVLAAAQRHLDVDKLVTVVVGDAKSIKPKIEKALGMPVEMLQLKEEDVKIVQQTR